MSAEKNLNSGCPEPVGRRPVGRASTPQIAPKNRLEFLQNATLELRQNVPIRNDSNPVFSMTYARFYSHLRFD
jgi:hypothetical protein